MFNNRGSISSDVVSESSISSSVQLVSLTQTSLTESSVGNIPPSLLRFGAVLTFQACRERYGASSSFQRRRLVVGGAWRSRPMNRFAASLLTLAPSAVSSKNANDNDAAVRSSIAAA